jgi:hypothetical protein
MIHGKNGEAEKRTNGIKLPDCSLCLPYGSFTKIIIRSLRDDILGTQYLFYFFPFIRLSFYPLIRNMLFAHLLKKCLNLIHYSVHFSHGDFKRLVRRHIDSYFFKSWNCIIRVSTGEKFKILVHHTRFAT